MKTVLVTGGCGFLGRELVRQLIARGYEVIVADDLSHPDSRVEPGYEFHLIDVSDLEKAKPVFQKAEICIALASRRGAIGYVDRHPAHVLAGNAAIYEGTFQAAVHAGMQRIIFISSSMVFAASDRFPTREEDVTSIPAPNCVFGRSKLLGEWYCEAFRKAYGLSYTILRPSNIYGPEERSGKETGDSHVIPELMEKILRGQHPLVLLGSGRQTRCFIHVRDIARGILVALESKAAANQAFNMGGFSETSILELASLLWHLAGREEPFETSFTPGFEEDVQRQCMDISKARDILDFSPSVSLEEGLKEILTVINPHFGPFSPSKGEKLRSNRRGERSHDFPG